MPNAHLSHFAQGGRRHPHPHHLALAGSCSTLPVLQVLPLPSLVLKSRPVVFCLAVIILRVIITENGWLKDKCREDKQTCDC